MAFVTGTKNAFSVKAYQGDNKTLLAFNFQSRTNAANLAGFTIQCQPPGQPAYYLLNTLQFENPAQHAQIAAGPPHSSANAPIQKYRWTHVTGSAHQGTNPATGIYAYTVTPRYFDSKGNMLALDSSRSATVKISVGPFKKGALALGFTRGYMQSEAFAHHFGLNAHLMPAGKPLQFQTTASAGVDAQGQSFSYEDEYQWMGASARILTFSVLNQLLYDSSLSLRMFAYDFNEPDIVGLLLNLAAQGRARVILDNASLHTNKAGTTPEDQFTALFKQKATGNAAILRGHFARYSHDKILIVSKNNAPILVLTGSTNFSITGLYVNANHFLVFDDPIVAAEYAKVFDESWNDNCSASTFAKSTFATAPFTPHSTSVPNTTINFSPHNATYVATLLGKLVNRINSEAGQPKGSVIFAVMQLTGGQNPVYDALNQVHSTQSIFSYGISDAPAGTFLYQPAERTGVLVTGKPGKTTLPPPFDQVPSPPGHEIHDKFVVCGLNGPDPVVYCGSSNLAVGGEHQNGDNLLEIHDADIATAFAIEALLLIDHYNFLDRYAQAKTGKKTNQPAKSKAAKSTAKTSATKALRKKSAPPRRRRKSPVKTR